MTAFTTDKVTVHGYLPEYERIAAELGPAARVLELGVAEGESLRLWQHLFPAGVITGVDCAGRGGRRCSAPPSRSCRCWHGRTGSATGSATGTA